MTIIEALLIVVITSVLGFFDTWFSYMMMSQPLVLGPIVGLILGNFEQGVIMGATMQLIFLGVMGIGGTLPPNAGMGTILGTAFAITMGAGPEVALALAVPIAMLGSVFTLITFSIRSMLNPFVENLCKKGNTRGIEMAHVLIGALTGLPSHITLFFALYLGSEPVAKLMEKVPEFITAGMDTASDMIPAVGIALLLRLMWNKKVAVWFFLGFLLVSFLGLSMLAVVCLGAVIAVVLFLENWSRTSNVTAAAGAGEEELFND